MNAEASHLAPRVISIQLGAREHYAVPRALHRRGVLAALITDIWWEERQLISHARLGERFHPGLAAARVIRSNMGWTCTDTLLRTWRAATRGSDWSLFIARNRLFDRFTARHIDRMHRDQLIRPGDAVFAYSYAATRTFQVAARNGMRTILGQIDGGPHEADIVRRETELHPELRERHSLPPDDYWRDWQRQCQLASRIIVNSPWARECLLRAGIEATKLTVVPLFYEGSSRPERGRPRAPSRFGPERPLRILFLGQFNLRKGAARVLEAARIMKEAPVEFRIVGPSTVTIPLDVLMQSNFRYVGPVPRSQVGVHYDAADVFLLPTLSDGFALTQLEAQWHNLPIVVSRHCGEVVRHGENGLVLDEVTGEAIAAAMRSLLKEPALLAAMSSRSVPSFGSLDEYASQLLHAIGGA